jgi:hypothetical protein
VHKFWIDQLFILPVLWVLPLQRLRLAFVVFSSSGVFFFIFLIFNTDRSSTLQACFRFIYCYIN